MTNLSCTCACGKVSCNLDVPSANAGNHVVCHCPDCRASAIHLGQPDPGIEQGIELWQTTPDKLQILQGAEHLAIQQLSPNGLLRWYASCCNTPMFNTLSKPRLAFVGILANTLSDTAPLGPLIGRAFQKGPDGKYRHEGFRRIGMRIVRKMLWANLTGGWRKTPFFDKQGTLTASSKVLTKDERAAATPADG